MKRKVSLKGRFSLESRGISLCLNGCRRNPVEREKMVTQEKEWIMLETYL